MDSDLLNIKKYYGEKMMHLCRNLFSTLLETEGLLFKLIEENFAYSKILYDDIIENDLIDNFKNYIYSLIDVEQKEVSSIKTPKELMDKAGYILYECKTEQDIQKFKKYYNDDERLCTFNGGRLKKCYVFFAVKKNVDEIRRKDFLNPSRQDEYGTSVISIQFSRGENNTLSIKNRYNHTVRNPDATFSNNLENIIPGLTKSFEDNYYFNINQNNDNKLCLSNYVKANDGKYYKYNYEIRNTYYCPDNIIIDNFDVINKYQEKEKFLIMDYFIIDLENKKVSLYDKELKDSFVERLDNIKLIEIIKDKENKHKKIGIVLENQEKLFIEIDKNNRMIYYKDDIFEVKDDYLFNNLYLQEVSLPNVQIIGNNFLTFNEWINSISIPRVEKVGYNFLKNNRNLQKVDLSKIQIIGDRFLEYNRSLQEISLPSVQIIGNNFLSSNECISRAYLPNVIRIGTHFLEYNINLQEIELPNVQIIGNFFLSLNESIKSINLLNVEEIGSSALTNNKCLQEITLPKVIKVWDDFLYSNECINSVNMPNVEEIGSNVFKCNMSLQTINLPKVKKIWNDFLYFNECINDINVPSVERIGSNVLTHNKCLQEINLPNVRKIWHNFLSFNECLNKVNIPNVEEIGSNFLEYNKSLLEINLPKVQEIGNGFLFYNQCIQQIDMPNIDENTDRFYNEKILRFIRTSFLK